MFVPFLRLLKVFRRTRREQEVHSSKEAALPSYVGQDDDFELISLTLVSPMMRLGGRKANSTKVSSTDVFLLQILLFPMMQKSHPISFGNPAL